MIYKEVGFRAVYHKFVIVNIYDKIAKIIDGFPGAKDANALITYGYYDREAGLTLEILACAILTEDGFQYASGNDTISVKLRIGFVAEEELTVYSDKDGELSKVFAEKLDMLKIYDSTEIVEKTREMTILDSCRHEYFIDDVLVVLEKDGLQNEGCWVRITGLGEKSLIGELLDEPYQDFGCHKGAEISFYLAKTKEDKIMCFASM